MCYMSQSRGITLSVLTEGGKDIIFKRWDDRWKTWSTRITSINGRFRHPGWNIVMALLHYVEGLKNSCHPTIIPAARFCQGTLNPPTIVHRRLSSISSTPLIYFTILCRLKLEMRKNDVVALDSVLNPNISNQFKSIYIEFEYSLLIKYKIESKGC